MRGSERISWSPGDVSGTSSVPLRPPGRILHARQRPLRDASVADLRASDASVTDLNTSNASLAALSEFPAASCAPCVRKSFF